MNGTLYSVKNVICKPWRDIYEVNTPTGIVRIDAIYNGAGLFTNLVYQNKFHLMQQNNHHLREATA